MTHYRRSRAPGATWFFTVTLANRRSSLLVDEIDHLRAAYREAQTRLPFCTVAICVLPDHLHAVWKLPAGDNDFAGRWSLIKSRFSSQMPAASVRPSLARRREKGIWQRRYWEHQIRDELDLQRHVDYLHFNPVKHELVGRVVDWRYSSFHRFVRDGRLSCDWAGSAVSDGRFGEA